MTKTKFTKIIIDILMYADFIFLMSHGTVRNLSIHAYGGMALFALFVVHHILNGCFYKTQLYFYLFNTGNWKMAAENFVTSYLEYTGIILLMSI